MVVDLHAARCPAVPVVDRIQRRLPIPAWVGSFRASSQKVPGDAAGCITPDMPGPIRLPHPREVGPAPRVVAEPEVLCPTVRAFADVPFRTFPDPSSWD